MTVNRSMFTKTTLIKDPLQHRMKHVADLSVQLHSQFTTKNYAIAAWFRATPPPKKNGKPKAAWFRAVPPKPNGEKPPKPNGEKPPKPNGEKPPKPNGEKPPKPP